MKKDRNKLFTETPIWKLIIKMAIPAIIIMSVVGLYGFSDSVLAINLASHKYTSAAAVFTDKLKYWNKSTSHIIINSKDLVRMIMAYTQPQFNLLLALTLFFSVGISTRVSIKLGRQDKKGAINTMKTGLFFSLVVSFISIFVFIFTSKSWVRFQANGLPEYMKNWVANESYKYIWIMMLVNPFYFFSFIISSLFRVEGRMKEATLAMIIPVIFNLFLDWILMGPCGMGIEGAALATLIGDLITFLVVIIIILKMKDSIVTFHNLFGKFNWISIVGIVLIGISPFFRNCAQSLTSTIQQHILGDVERMLVEHHTITPSLMRNIVTGVFPIFGLFFPMLFGILQAASPIAAYNYGAKKIERVKTTVKYSMLFTFIFGLIIYALSVGVLATPLLYVLGFVNKGSEVLLKDSKKVIAILMISTPLFAPAIGGMVLFSSTDRILLSFISSIIRGFILFLPMIYLFKYISIQNPNFIYTYWFLFPSLSAVDSVIIFIMSIFTWRRLENQHMTLEERIEIITQKLKRKSKSIN